MFLLALLWKKSENSRTSLFYINHSGTETRKYIVANEVRLSDICQTAYKPAIKLILVT
jgi:hypothetical protein